MAMRTHGHPPPVYGVALDGTSLVAMRDAVAGEWRTALAPMNGTSWPELTEALRRLFADAAADNGRVSPRLRVALLPPLAEVRTVDLPPVSDDDARRLLARAAPRHFVDAREPIAVGLVPAASSRHAGIRPARIAAAVSLRLLRAVYAAARDAGAEVEVVLPAQAAWCRSSSAPEALQVAYADWQELVVASAGAPVSVRRFRAVGDEAQLLEAVGRLPATVIADPARSAAGALLTDGRLEGAKRAHPVWPLAFALPTERPHAPSRLTTRQTGVLLAAAVLAVGAIALQEFDVQRELDAVRAARARLAPALAARGAGRFDGGLALDTLVPSSWSNAIARAAEALPDEAFLSRIRAHGDTLVLSGAAARASFVYDALKAVPSFASVTASTPVRRETTIDDEVVERFEFTVRLAPPETRR